MLENFDFYYQAAHMILNSTRMKYCNSCCCSHPPPPPSFWFPDRLLSKQEGATKDDIDQLSKFKFQRVDNNEKLSGDGQGPFGGIMTECGTDSPNEHVLSEDDAVCSLIF